MFNPFRAKTVRQATSTEPAPAVEPAPEKPALEVVTNQPPDVVPQPAPAPPPRPAAVLAQPAPVPLPLPTPYSPPAPAPAGGTVPLSTAASTALEQLVAKLPGLLFAGLTEVETGTAIRGRTPGDLLPAAALARYHADIIRLERQALKQAAQGAAPEALREMLVTMSDQLHLLRLVRDGELLLSLVLDPRQISLPTARLALQAAANSIG